MELGSIHWRHTRSYLALMSALLPLGASGQISTADPLALPTEFKFSTVANMGDCIPPAYGKNFNSFNQPSVNTSGLVVLRARSKGGDGEVGGEEGPVVACPGAVADNKPVRGIYSRQMGAVPGNLAKVFDNRTPVPFPNNTYYNSKGEPSNSGEGSLSTFTEFPAFPRIGADSSTILTRAQSKPVWTWSPAPDTETRAGSSGIYAMRLGEPVSAMTQLGIVPPTAEYNFSFYAVPGASTTIKFDQFPGSPAVAGWNTVAFKGNFTDAGAGKTGIFFRRFSALAPKAKTQVIASSDTLIPGAGNIKFGSTAPPSAADISVVFLGLDNEESPERGGIYQAALLANSPLRTLVRIGGAVPGEPGAKFERLGEALSYDGRFVAFWGGWGGMRPVEVKCPADGQKDVVAYCQANAPGPNFSYMQQVPVKQGFFVHDSLLSRTYTVVKTGDVYSDFLYWTFSGRPPGVGDSDSEDFEPPRWRSAAFAASWGGLVRAQVAFKGRKVGTPIVDGIYMTVVGPTGTPVIKTVAETGAITNGGMIDPRAEGIPITALGIERDGLRNGWLAFAASMANELTSWAGVYVTRTLK